MYILLLFLFVHSITSCPLHVFNPQKFHFIKNEKLFCIEFDMVVDDPYSNIIIIPNYYNKITANIVTENNIEKQISLKLQHKCWSLPISLYGVIKDPIICMEYPENVWPKQIKDLSLFLHILQYKELEKNYKVCTISRSQSSIENIEINNIENGNICTNSSCKNCIPSCKLLLHKRGSYVCDGKINHIQVPTLFPNHETPLFSFKSHKYISTSTITWCIDFLFLPSVNVNVIDLHIIGYNSKGSIIDMQQACKPFSINENPGKVCFITNKNTELHHLKIYRLVLYYPSYSVIIKNTIINLNDLHLKTKKTESIPEEPCINMSCEKWIMSNETCFSGISNKMTHHNINKSLLFTGIFVIIFIIIICVLLYLGIVHGNPYSTQTYYVN